jgi:methyltransferase (TIGR00027 family)
LETMAEIENVSDTARWVAVYRAMETERRDAIFRDPFAARLAGPKGAAIVDSMKRGRQMAWAMIVRTAVFDELILERVRNGGVDQIVNLAAGLDARPWRMSTLPASLRWVDVDLPGILDYKLDVMKDERPLMQYDAVRLDLRDAPKRKALFSQLGGQSKRTLVISEGLLIYLTAEDVASLAADLHGPPSFQWWVFDIAHPRLLEMMTKMWGRNVQAGTARFQFAPAEGTKFFEPFGWEEAEFRSNTEEARRLKREMSMMWLWRLFARLRSRETREIFRRAAGSVLMKRM